MGCLVGGDTMVELLREHHQPNVEGRCATGMYASKCPDRIKKINPGRVEKKKNPPPPEIKTVIFVPQTANSVLAKMLRQDETFLEKVTGYRVKYVEKPGQNLGSQLVRSNPWAGQDCGRLGCLLCETKTKSGKNMTQSCSKRNLTYQTWCHTCKERDDDGKEDDGKEQTRLYTYVGETQKACTSAARSTCTTWRT